MAYVIFARGLGLSLHGLGTDRESTVSLSSVLVREMGRRVERILGTCVGPEGNAIDVLDT